jgi:hypothetical protein
MERRMKYLCLIYFEETAMDALSENDRQTLVREANAYEAALKASGQMLASSPLQRVASATTVRMRNGKLSTTDGPFAETKEQLGGFILVEARDLNEAIRIAANSPLAKHCSIEVRPLPLPKTGGETRCS